MDLHHQMAPAPQIQPQPDILIPVLDQFLFRLRQPDNAVHANQNDRDDGHQAKFKIAFHVGYFFSSTAFGPSTRLVTALRITCNLILSGFTRSTSVVSVMLIMVPTMPPVVKTSVPV